MLLVLRVIVVCFVFVCSWLSLVCYSMFVGVSRCCSFWCCLFVFSVVCCCVSLLFLACLLLRLLFALVVVRLFVVV